MKCIVGLELSLHRITSSIATGGDWRRTQSLVSQRRRSAVSQPLRESCPESRRLLACACSSARLGDTERFCFETFEITLFDI